MHILSDLRFENTEVMIFHFLSFRSGGADECAAAEEKIPAFLKEFFADQEIFLLRTYCGDDPADLLVAEQVQNLQGFLIQHFHRPQKRCLFVEGLSAVRTEGSGNI